MDVLTLFRCKISFSALSNLLHIIGNYTRSPFLYSHTTTPQEQYTAREKSFSLIAVSKQEIFCAIPILTAMHLVFCSISQTTHKIPMGLGSIQKHKSFCSRSWFHCYYSTTSSFTTHTASIQFILALFDDYDYRQKGGVHSTNTIHIYNMIY